MTWKDDSACLPDNVEMKLVNDSICGNKESFSKLVTMYSEAILRMVVAKVGDMSLAEDIAQETFLRAYRNLESFRHTGNFGAWLRGIAQNCIREWYKKRKPETVSINESIIEQVDSNYQQGVNLVLNQAMDTLKGDLQQIVLMRLEGKTCAEIAQVLNKPLNTVTKYLSRAYQKLEVEINRLLKENYDELQ